MPTYYPLNGYKIDGYDLYGTWKISVEKISGLYQFLTRKGDVSQSWSDSDGEEPFTDANDIYFEGRDIIMFCFIQASSYGYFWYQLGLFKHRLELPGLKTLHVPYDPSPSYTRSLMYVKGSDVEMLSPRKKTNLFVGKFWVQFRETTPTRS
jgi:hypothetical protein